MTKGKHLKCQVNKATCKICMYNQILRIGYMLTMCIVLLCMQQILIEPLMCTRSCDRQYAYNYGKVDMVSSLMEWKSHWENG